MIKFKYISQFQLEKQHKELKEGNKDDTEDDQDSDNDNGAMSNDDLAPYLPDVNSIESSQILDTCVKDFELERKDATEEDNDNDDVSNVKCKQITIFFYYIWILK